MKYVLCLHRWAGTQALYEKYGLPDDTGVRAICSEESLAILQDSHFLSASTVGSMDDADAVIRAANNIIDEYGNPSLIVALNEGDLLIASSLRERYNIAGSSHESVDCYRDKLKMAKVAARQDAVRILPAADAESGKSVSRFGSEYGYPLILKPRYGTASRGVRFVKDAKYDLSEHLFMVEPMMVQQFFDAPIFHIDGWWDGNQIVVGVASRYLNNCANFSEDSPLGSIELPEGEEQSLLHNGASALLNAFSSNIETVFHLELFKFGNELVFLEIGARVGGAEIPFLWREIRDTDLVGIAWEIQTGASNSCRNHARKLSLESSLYNKERGAWVIAQKEEKSLLDSKSLYWSQDWAPYHSCNGVYEGAKTRLRLRNVNQEELHNDLSRYVEQLR